MSSRFGPWADKLFCSPTSNNFTAIRWLLAALVIYTHSYGLLLKQEPTLFHHTFGSFAVQSFFALSGYFIIGSYVRINAFVPFAINRTLRIAPALIVALIFSSYLGGVFDNFANNPTPYIVNGPVWTLSWEVVCYAGCALLGVLGLLNEQSLGAILASSWVVILANYGSSETYAAVVPLFLLFVTGGYISVKEDSLHLRKLGLVATVILGVLLIDNQMNILAWFFKAIPFLYGPKIPIGYYYTVIYLLFLPFSLIYLGKYVRFNLRVKNDYSYGLYVYGWPVEQGLITVLNPRPLVLFLLAMGITQLLAFCSWHFLEKKALKLKR